MLRVEWIPSGSREPLTSFRDISFSGGPSHTFRMSWDASVSNARNWRLGEVNTRDCYFGFCLLFLTYDQTEMNPAYMSVYSPMFRLINDDCVHLHNFAFQIQQKQMFPRRQEKSVLNLAKSNWVPRIDLSRDPHVPTLLGISVVIWYHQSISDNFRKYKSTDLSAISSRDGLKQLFWQRMYGWLYEIIPCLLRPPSPNGFYFTVILGALNQKKMLPCPGKIPLGAVTVSTKSLSESLIMELLQAVSLDDI